MDVTFADERLEAFIKDKKKAGNRYKKYARDAEFYVKLVRAIDILHTVECTNDLYAYSYLHYEPLKHQDTVISSIRIMGGGVERLIFEELESGIKVLVLELDNKHYGNKK